MTVTTPTDLIAALQTLTAEQLRDRLRALDRERCSVVALLRSVSARERAAARHTPRPAQPEEAPPCRA